MSDKIKQFGAGPISERLLYFQAMLDVHRIRIRFSKTEENIAACKILHGWLLRFGQMSHVSTHRKNDEQSKSFRLQGNELFRKREDLSNALQFYNQAICWAEPGGEDLGTAFANRSAIYLHWKLYDICIKNIDLAVAAGCPAKILPKLEQRKAYCISGMENDKKERNVEHNVSGGGVTLHMHVKTIRDRRAFQASRYSFDCRNKRKEPQLRLKSNPRVPFIVNSLEMRSNAEQGRYVVTNEDLKPGQIISVEQPYTNSLTKDHRYRKCANCFEERFLSLIPCEFCTCTMYCSEKCLRESATSFHLYECPVADYLWQQCEEYALTLRMVVKAFTTFNSVDELIEFRKTNKANVNQSAFTFDHTNDSVDDKIRYGWVDNLVTNEQRRVKDDMFERCCKVAILYHHLIEKTRFGEILRTERERDTLMAIILQHTQTTSVNCVNCYQYDDLDIEAFMELKPLDVFSRGIYPLTSLYNHSCAPNVATIAAGTKMVTYVTRPIKSNEEVTVCYKRYSHFEYDKKTRITNLSLMYGFNCKCSACIHDYPKWWASDGNELERGNRTDEMAYLSETFPFDLTEDHSNIERFCTILDTNADLYPCLSLVNISLKLHRALTLEFGNISTELQVMLNKNHSDLQSAMEALANRRR